MPTLREIRQLRPADAEGGTGLPGPGNWTLAHGIVFATAVPLSLICLIVASFAAYQKSQIDTTPPTLQDLFTKSPDPLDRLDFELLTLPQTWDVWTRFRETQLAGRPAPLYLLNRERSRWLSWRMLWAGVGAGVGLVAVVATLLLARGSSRS